MVLGEVDYSERNLLFWESIQHYLELIQGKEVIQNYL